MQLNVRKADAGSACQAQRGDVGHSAVEREGCKEEVRKEGCAEAGLWGGATDRHAGCIYPLGFDSMDGS